MAHFYETKVFQRRVDLLLDPDEYAALQGALISRPDAGDILERTGGCRKLRWQTAGKGKSGGVRVIYYWYRGEGAIFLLLVYSKSEKGNLTDAERIALRKLIKGR